jgi:hypothetical protein
MSLQLRRLLDHTKGLPFNIKYKGVAPMKQPVNSIADEDAGP